MVIKICDGFTNFVNSLISLALAPREPDILPEVNKGEIKFEDENLLKEILSNVLEKNELDGIRILVSAGPTREPIDPVRFISNYSSGKMGYALAKKIDQ